MWHVQTFSWKVVGAFVLNTGLLHNASYIIGVVAIVFGQHREHILALKLWL